MASQILILAVLILLSAIFSGSETAFISLSKSKVDELVGKRARNSKVLKKLKHDPHKLLITILIGNNIVNIGASAYAAVLFSGIFASNAVGIATGIMTFLILVFGEITPKSFAHQHAVGVSLFMARPIHILQIIIFPFVWFFDKITGLVNHILGNPKPYTVTEGELVAMLKISEKGGAIEKKEREFIENVLEFNDIEVGDVMTPRVTIEALDSELTVQEAVDFVKKHSHSRLPVYKNDIDHIIGFISIKELLKYFDECSPNKKLRTLDLNVPLEVPFTKKINRLFLEFQRKHIHLAIVIDEYGGTAGIVTLEDLLEEIVGEIMDETDYHEIPMEIINKSTIITRGNILIEDVNDFFQMKIGPDDHDTLNTMLLEHLHRFPREGETVRLPFVIIHILKMKKNVVYKAKITKRKKKY